MKTLNFFSKLFLLFIAVSIPLSCSNDDNGGGTVFVDTEAVYSVKTAKAIGDYTSGESLATVSDKDGNITKATLKSGSNLPAGTELSGTTGEIKVSNVGLLVAGSHSITIITTDVKDGTTEHALTVVFNENEDAAAVYTIAEAKELKDYVVDESIATVIDADGDITGATLESGSELPAGTMLNDTTGEITIADATLLMAGSYQIGITTSDAEGGSTMNTVTLEFKANAVLIPLNSGGDEVVFTDITFLADQYFVGTSTAFTAATTHEIEDTDKDAIFNTERYGSDFGYDVELENGNYKVTLHFAEFYWGVPGDDGASGGTGDRVFDVSIEGNVVLDDFDIFDEVGGLKAVDKEFTIALEDGILNINFLASVDNAKISAITIEKVE